MRRIGVLSNPRSGTSLMVRLLVLGFDLTGTLPLFPHLGGQDVYEYRADVKDLRQWGDETYVTVFVVRDPRAVITSKHPSQPEDYFIDFGLWYNNYQQCLDYRSVADVHEVRYEELLSQPNRVQHQLSGALSLPITMSFEEAAVTHVITAHAGWDRLNYEMGPPRPLDPKHVRRWTSPQFKARLSSQLAVFPELTQVLIDLGYEQDDSWVENLNV